MRIRTKALAGTLLVQPDAVPSNSKSGVVVALLGQREHVDDIKRVSRRSELRTLVGRS